MSTLLIATSKIVSVTMLQIPLIQHKIQDTKDLTICNFFFDVQNTKIKNVKKASEFFNRRCSANTCHTLRWWLWVH